MAGFTDICGHEQTIAHMKNALVSGKVSHAYLIAGEEGSGKKTLARAFAMALQCESRRGKASGGSSRMDEADACGKCKSCIMAMSSNHPDIILQGHEKAKLFSVDDARSLVEDIQIRPYMAPYKVYIVPDAQMMNPQAQNALLKTLEEPPEYAVLLLLTTNPESMLDTIRSRCVHLELKPLSDRQVTAYLKEHRDLKESDAQIYSAFAQGNIGRALKLADSEEFRAMAADSISISSGIRGFKIAEIAEQVKKLQDYKPEIEDLLDLFALWTRDVLYFKATNDLEGIVFKNNEKEIMAAASDNSYPGLQKIIDAINKAKLRLRANVGFDLTMELLLLTMNDPENGSF